MNIPQHAYKRLGLDPVVGRVEHRGICQIFQKQGIVTYVQIGKITYYIKPYLVITRASGSVQNHPADRITLVFGAEVENIREQIKAVDCRGSQFQLIRQAVGNLIIAGGTGRHTNARTSEQHR